MPAFLSAFGIALIGPTPMMSGSMPADRVAHEARDRREALRLGLLAAHDDDGGGAIRVRARVAGGDGAVAA